ncbi:GLOBIN domain-containing protein [Trichostrongylus colubriformis]|uniref:GLOBIN domain-containing protein n=1 Tax=Trichostrongylus colubriformis TaxID=6319 RepID=A0AAN8F3P9_TRICO
MLCTWTTRKVMSLFSTIRGRKGAPVIGSTAVGPIASRSKNLVIQEWPRMLENQPNLFSIAWTASASRSNSIKKTFGMGQNENPSENESFMKIWPAVQDFFHKLIIEMQLDDDLVRNACEDMGARHVDYIARGFNSNFWDIFLVCMAEVVDETLCTYFTDEAKRPEMILAWQRVFNTVVHHMRTGYIETRKKRLKNGTKTEC